MTKVYELAQTTGGPASVAMVECDQCHRREPRESAFNWVTLERVADVIVTPNEKMPEPDLCSWDCVIAYAQRMRST